MYSPIRSVNIHLAKRCLSPDGPMLSGPPEYLLEKIVLASTEEGQVILDPFCGSGTTVVAAKELNRRFIGVDQSENSIKIIKSRLDKPTNTLDDLIALVIFSS